MILLSHVVVEMLQVNNAIILIDFLKIFPGMLLNMLSNFLIIESSITFIIDGKHLLKTLIMDLIRIRYIQKCW